MSHNYFRAGIVTSIIDFKVDYPCLYDIIHDGGSFFNVVCDHNARASPVYVNK